MKEKIDKVNPNCELLTTRKTFPFSKRFCIKAATCGGAMPHRLGLSETILFFDGHRIIYKNNEEFYEAIKNIKNKTSEKSVITSYSIHYTKLYECRSRSYARSARMRGGQDRHRGERDRSGVLWTHAPPELVYPICS